MSNSINSNITSLRVQRELAGVDRAQSKTFERLSSGLRINRASDDPSGLALSSKLNVDNRVYAQGVRNVNDGISAVNIASSTLFQLSDVLTRLKELATQAANGVLSLTQRRALDTESYALTNEYNRLAGTTRFNGRSLLDGSISNLGVQAGYGNNGQISGGFGQKFVRTVGDGTFKAPVSYATVAAGPWDVETADFNGDGKLDLASTSTTDGAISIQLGNGDGTFQTATTYDSGTNSYMLALGDVTGDGRVDIVTNDGTNDRTHVLINNGNGTFQTSVSYLSGDNSWDVQLADFNGDGTLDIVTGSTDDNKVNVLLNKGNGTYQALVSYSTGVASADNHDLTVGDFNSDGKQDVAITDYTDRKVLLLLGNGNGSFQTALSYTASAAGSGPFAISSGDLNHDGNLDIAVLSLGENKLNVLLGKGNGTFQTLVSYEVADPGMPIAFTYGLELTDVNGDGNLDVVATAFFENKLNILIGNGDGTFKARISYATDADPYYIAAGDFNGDGATDLAVASNGTNKIDIYLPNTTTTSTIPRLNLTTQAEARGALSVIDATQTRVSREQGVLGAFESRLSRSLQAVLALRDNLSIARSRVTDADVAQETADLVRFQVKQSTATALLAQANQLPGIVLELLRDSLP